MHYNAQLGRIEDIYLQGGGGQLRKFISTGDQGHKCGGVVHSPDICFSWSPNECSQSQNICY